MNKLVVIASAFTALAHLGIDAASVSLDEETAQHDNHRQLGYAKGFGGPGFIGGFGGGDGGGGFGGFGTPPLIPPP